MTIYGEISDIERDIVTWLLAMDEVEGADIATPADLEDHLPFVRVGLVGGTDDDVTDYPLIDVDCFAPSLDGAKDLAGKIRARLRPRTRVGSAIIDTVRMNTSPRPLPWSNETIKRVSATYALGRRR